MYGNSIGVTLSSSGKYIVVISDHLGNSGNGQVEICTRATTTTAALGSTAAGTWTCAFTTSPSTTAAPVVGGGPANVWFGRYVCMDDVYMMVGAPGDGANGADGSYYVYKRDSNDVYQDESQQLTVTQGSPVECTIKGNYFAAFAINGAGVSVGFGNSDAFYVFEKNSTGTWNEKLFLHDSDCQGGGWQGSSYDTSFVIIDDTTSSPYWDNFVRLEAGCTTYANTQFATPASYPTGRQTGAVFTFNIEQVPGGGAGSGSGSGSGTASGSDDLGDGDIAGIAVGCVAFVAAVILVFACCRRRRRSDADGSQKA
jgi:hypothetical protein